MRLRENEFRLRFADDLPLIVVLHIPAQLKRGEFTNRPTQVLSILWTCVVTKGNAATPTVRQSKYFSAFECDCDADGRFQSAESSKSVLCGKAPGLD